MVNETINYYNRNADGFYSNTVDANMEEHYAKFEKLIKANGRILDAGCGSGRDSLHFLKNNFKVDAFDASIEMVRLSRELTGLETMQASFDSYVSTIKYDGIWACASLLHVDRDSMPRIIAKFAGMLNKGGIFFMSFKYGDRVYEKDGREFNCYNEALIQNLINESGELSPIDVYKTADVRKERENEYWLSVMAIKN